MTIVDRFLFFRECLAQTSGSELARNLTHDHTRQTHWTANVVTHWTPYAHHGTSLGTQRRQTGIFASESFPAQTTRTLLVQGVAHFAHLHTRAEPHTATNFHVVTARAQARLPLSDVLWVDLQRPGLLLYYDDLLWHYWASVVWWATVHWLLRSIHLRRLSSVIGSTPLCSIGSALHYGCIAASLLRFYRHFVVRQNNVRA